MSEQAACSESSPKVDLYGCHFKSVITVHAVWTRHCILLNWRAIMLIGIMRLPHNCAQIIPATNQSIYILLNAIKMHIIQLSDNRGQYSVTFFRHFYTPRVTDGRTENHRYG